MITDQIRRVFERVPYIRFYFSPYFFIFYPARDTFFLQLSFYILHFAPHFCVETGDNESAHAEIELWRNNCRLQMLAQKSFFFKWKPNRFPIFRSFTTRKCWHKKPLFEWKPSTNSICKQIQSEYLLNTYNHHPGDQGDLRWFCWFVNLGFFLLKKGRA